MAQRLFLLDGMALVYRAHFAFAGKPIRTSKGFNTSAIFGFVNTLLDILQAGAPTHLAVAFDTEAPTPRHAEFPAYKAQREAMPEELGAALPAVRRFIEAFRIPVITLDGFEADDLIGTLVRRAEPAGFESFMVTPDKDFGQLVTERTRLWRPGRQGGEHEIWGPREVCERWGVARVEQVVDMLGLMGDATDNIPGVPGVGEKTAAKLLAQFGSLEEVLAHAGDVKGRLGENLRRHAEQARLSRHLATIITDAPVAVQPGELALGPRDDAALAALCVEFEFNAIGRRLFGEGFKAGRGAEQNAEVRSPKSGVAAPAQGDLFGVPAREAAEASSAEAAVEPNDTPAEPEAGVPAGAGLRTIADVPHRYELVATAEARRELAAQLAGQPAFCFDTETDGLNPRESRLLGVAFSFAAGEGYYVAVSPEGPSPRPCPTGRGGSTAAADMTEPQLVADAPLHPSPPGRGGGGEGSPPELADFLPVFSNPAIVKVGHNLKFDLQALRAHGVAVAGPFFDTMIAHALVEPEQRHGMDYLSEVYLGYTPIAITRLIGPKDAPQRPLSEVPVEQVAEYAAEDADVTWQLYGKLRPLLAERAQRRVFHEVEMPVLPALAAMEFEGIRVDAAALAEFSAQLAKEIAAAEADIHRLAGRAFNVNSNKQLGDVLFSELKLVEKPRKTPTGQFATDEQTLLALAGSHEIVRRILDYRAAAKLKSTYADALPQAISPRTGRVHTTYTQAATATGRLSSNDPNLQNIPIRTELGQEIRRAFVARDADHVLLSADYSQIELRIIASMSREEAMLEAFRRGEDIHRSTAARVFGVPPAKVTPEQRRRAKMVNFGIAYGMSAHGLAQRLGIPRGEAAAIIEQYFASFPGIRGYMEATIAFAQRHGYVETLTGRRRWLRDIGSANATVRAAAERNAINAPIQGTAADMIKLAMGAIHAELARRGLRARMLLQVHDELLFDVPRAEEAEVRALVVDKMKHALPLAAPIEVGIGVGANWLEAH